MCLLDYDYGSMLRTIRLYQHFPRLELLLLVCHLLSCTKSDVFYKKSRCSLGVPLSLF